MNAYEFAQKQALPYEAKLTHAKLRAREFYDHCQGDVFCSVGGLDRLELEKRRDYTVTMEYGSNAKTIWAEA